MIITSEDRRMAKTVFNNSFSTQKTNEDIFYELCFCICAPQTSFKNNFKAISDLRQHDYYYLGDYAPGPLSEGTQKEWLAKVLKSVRFYNNKSKWVTEAKQKFTEILELLRHKELSPDFKRNWLVKNVKGLGMKTASHLLRNLGETDFAIIDVHVLRFLRVDGKWKYEELEKKLREMAKKRGLTLAEFDIIIWKKYSKTPWEKFIY